MCTGVVEVFALEVNPGTTEIFREAFGEIKRRGTSNEILQERVEFRLKCRVLTRLFILGGQFIEGRHEGLGHKHATKGAKVAVGVGKRFRIHGNRDL